MKRYIAEFFSILFFFFLELEVQHSSSVIMQREISLQLGSLKLCNYFNLMSMRKNYFISGFGGFFGMDPLIDCHSDMTVKYELFHLFTKNTTKLSFVILQDPMSRNYVIIHVTQRLNVTFDCILPTGLFFKKKRTVNINIHILKDHTPACLRKKALQS